VLDWHQVFVLDRDGTLIDSQATTWPGGAGMMVNIRLAARWVQESIDFYGDPYEQFCFV
jgi:hypothetical protein